MRSSVKKLCDACKVGCILNGGVGMLLISECRVYVGRGMFILFAQRIRSISSGRGELCGDGCGRRHIGAVGKRVSALRIRDSSLQEDGRV